MFGQHRRFVHGVLAVLVVYLFCGGEVSLVPRRKPVHDLCDRFAVKPYLKSILFRFPELAFLFEFVIGEKNGSLQVTSVRVRRFSPSGKNGKHCLHFCDVNFIAVDIDKPEVKLLFDRVVVCLAIFVTDSLDLLVGLHSECIRFSSALVESVEQFDESRVIVKCAHLSYRSHRIKSQLAESI